MKRTLQQQQQHHHRHYHVDETMPYYHELGSCLKRVRISMSPGELRLDRDLSELAAKWTHVDDRAYQCADARLERTNDPLRLLLRLQHAELHLMISRLYPHAPPVVTNVWNNDTPFRGDSSGSRIQQVIVSVKAPETQHRQPMQEEYAASTMNSNTIVYDQWSPIQQIGALLDFLVEAFRIDYHNYYSNSHSLLVCEDQVFNAMQISSPRKKQQPLDCFPPNRFDVGYDRQRRYTVREHL